VANKMDLPEAAAYLAKFKRRYKSADVLEISCATGAGLEKLKKELLKRVGKFRRVEKASLASSA
jgi:GTPase